jgi:hypothetical protein
MCRVQLTGWRPGDPTFCGSCFLEHKDRVAKRNAAAGPVPSLLPPPDAGFEAFRAKLQAKLLRGEKLTDDERDQMADLATLRALAGRRPGSVMRAADHLRSPESLEAKRAREAAAEEGQSRKPRPSDYGV